MGISRKMLATFFFVVALVVVACVLFPALRAKREGDRPSGETIRTGSSSDAPDTAPPSGPRASDNQLSALATKTASDIEDKVLNDKSFKVSLKVQEKEFRPEIIPIDSDKPLTLRLAPQRSTPVRYVLFSRTGKFLFVGRQTMEFAPEGDAYELKTVISWGPQYVAEDREFSTYTSSVANPIMHWNVTSPAITTGKYDTCFREVSTGGEEASKPFASFGGPGETRENRLGPDGKPLLFMDMEYSPPVFPKTEVKVGSCWDGRGEILAVAGPQDDYYEVTGFATVNGVETVVIKNHPREQEPEGLRSRVHKVFYISPSDGLAVYATRSTDFPDPSRKDGVLTSELYLLREKD